MRDGREFITEMTETWGHYLDHASTSPLRPAAREAMVAAMHLPLGDPSRMHRNALVARELLEQARAEVAAALGARPREVIFTSGATESIAAVCWGASLRSHGGVQVLSAIEHSAVRGSAIHHGPVRVVGCDRSGLVHADELLSAVDESTAVVHLQAGNHEVGTMQPIDSVIEACRERDVLVHVDAAQSIGRVPFDFRTSGADLVSISGHKLGGPAGTGILLVRRGVRLAPMLVGGDQERARRAGMENVIGAVGLAAAVASIDVDAETVEQSAHRDALAEAICSIEGVVRYGAPSSSLPHLLCVGIEDVEPQAVLLGLDRHGVRTHSGSACASEGLEPSPVLDAMGLDASHSLRFSTGWTTTGDDITRAAQATVTVLEELRSLRP